MSSCCKSLTGRCSQLAPVRADGGDQCQAKPFSINHFSTPPAVSPSRNHCPSQCPGRSPALHARLRRTNPAASSRCALHARACVQCAPQGPVAGFEQERSASRRTCRAPIRLLPTPTTSSWTNLGLRSGRGCTRCPARLGGGLGATGGRRSPLIPFCIPPSDLEPRHPRQSGQARAASILRPVHDSGPKPDILTTATGLDRVAIFLE